MSNFSRGKKKHNYSCFLKYYLIAKISYLMLCTSLVVQTVNKLPSMQETQVRSLDWEYLLEKEMATHFSILACRILWTDEPGRLQSMGSQSWT